MSENLGENPPSLSLSILAFLSRRLEIPMSVEVLKAAQKAGITEEQMRLL